MTDDLMEACDPPISDELLKAVGRLALAFARLENCLVGVLCQVDEEDGPSLSLADMKHKLDSTTLGGLINEFKESNRPDSKDIVANIWDLVTTRNALMHGMLWTVPGGTKEQERLFLLNLKNLWRGQIPHTIVSASEINQMAKDVNCVVFRIGSDPSAKPN